MRDEYDIQHTQGVRRNRVPRIDQHGEVVYFIDIDTRRWRVYDTTLARTGEHESTVVVHRFGSPAATTRVFVPPDPDALRHAYAFRPGDRRDGTIESLSRQLLVAVTYRRLSGSSRVQGKRVRSRRIVT